jgi:predicted unusual protein kinase regulating ubiquinone biosynthesis (AarF/ABC1/UbiB family)
MLDIRYPEGDSGNGEPKLGITLVDAGMVAQLTEEESFSFIGLMTSLGEGDGYAAAQHSLNFSVENNMTPEEKEAFTKDMVKLFEEKCRGYGNNVDVGVVLQSILGVIRDHRVRIDANYATLVINAMCVESLGKRVCPTYNVLEAARPLLQTYRKQCFDKDGYTRIASARHMKRIKRVMPFLLVRQKESHDKAFFKQIEIQRKTSRRKIARGGDKQPPKK